MHKQVVQSNDDELLMRAFGSFGQQLQDNQFQ